MTRGFILHKVSEGFKKEKKEAVFEQVL